MITLFLIVSVFIAVILFFQILRLLKERKKLINNAAEDMAEAAVWWKEYLTKEIPNRDLNDPYTAMLAKSLKAVLGWDIKYILDTPVEELKKQARIKTYKTLGEKVPKKVYTPYDEEWDTHYNDDTKKLDELCQVFLGKGTMDILANYKEVSIPLDKNNNPMKDENGNIVFKVIK